MDLTDRWMDSTDCWMDLSFDGSLDRFDGLLNGTLDESLDGMLDGSLDGMLDTVDRFPEGVLHFDIQVHHSGEASGNCTVSCYFTCLNRERVKACWGET